MGDITPVESTSAYSSRLPGTGSRTEQPEIALSVRKLSRWSPSWPPGHERVLTARHHPAILIGPFLFTFLGLLAALLFSTGSIRVHGLGLGLIWLAWIVIFLRLIWKCFDWTVGYFVVTNERIMQVSGVLRRRIKAIWLAQVTGITLKRSVLGEICGYAELIFHSPCPDAALLSLDYAPYPTQLESDLRELVFPHAEHDEDTRHMADSDAAVEPPWRKVSRMAPR